MRLIQQHDVADPMITKKRCKDGMDSGRTHGDNGGESLVRKTMLTRFQKSRRVKTSSLPCGLLNLTCSWLRRNVIQWTAKQKDMWLRSCFKPSMLCVKQRCSETTYRELRNVPNLDSAESQLTATPRRSANATPQIHLG